MSFGGQTPTIVVLKEGTDTSQGRGQVISNINACIAVQDIVRPTLGPLGSDVLLVDAQGKTTISNDGATILKSLEVVHPAASILVDISKSQDAEVGDGTTSVCVLAGELLREAKTFVEENVPVQTIIKGFRLAADECVSYLDELSTKLDEKDTEALKKCAATAMSSKILSANSDFFTKLAVESVLCLDKNLDEDLIGIKQVKGGAIEDSLLVEGTAFAKTFSYAGFEQQPKSFNDPKIVCLEVELELKAERDNAEVRVAKVEDYQAVVDAEWRLILDKLEAIESTGAQIVLSKLPIGDLATQFFADRNIFCAGRVTAQDMDRVVAAVGASVQNTCTDLRPEHLGTCARFEEKQIGNERFNLFTGCPRAQTCTLILRGGSEQFISEVERSLHDAIMVVKRTLKTNTIVAGGGACEMALSRHLREHARLITGREQLVVVAFARVLEVIPRQLCDNAGFDSTDILSMLRMHHSKGNIYYGVDFDTDGVADNHEKHVWEPALVKSNAIQSATEAACVIISVDETLKVQSQEQGMPR